MSRPVCRLYLITPARLPDPAAFGRVLAEALDAGDVGCVQIRLKDLADGEIMRALSALRPIIQKRDIACLLNDRPDLAREAGCDGVHIGQEDAPYAEARRLMGPEAIVGVTCHDSRDLALAAAEAGADYVAFGAFYPTATKDAKFAAGPEILEWWSGATTVPCVAIGGITAENCRPLVQAGADFLAVSAGVWSHPQGPAAGVKAINAAIGQARSA
jgi:thiamine-phosphate pyrophosphorylase